MPFWSKLISFVVSANFIISIDVKFKSASLRFPPLTWSVILSVSVFKPPSILSLLLRLVVVNSTKSSPLPPIMTSSPPPSKKVSSPPLPLRVSSPSKAEMTSMFEPPEMVSSVFVLPVKLRAFEPALFIWTDSIEVIVFELKSTSTLVFTIKASLSTSLATKLVNTPACSPVILTLWLFPAWS